MCMRLQSVGYSASISENKPLDAPSKPLKLLYIPELTDSEEHSEINHS